MRERERPLVFTNSVPKAKSLEIVNSDGSIVHAMPAIFGGLAGTNEYNIEEDATGKFKALKPTQNGNVLIIDNIKLDMSAGFFSEFWNNYIGALLITYEGYDVVYEIAEISPADLYDYVYANEKRTEEVPTNEVKKYAIFRGVVHSVSGNSMDIASPKTDSIGHGQLIIILDRNGRVAGKARVAATYHTKITATLISGSAQKGFSAEIY